MAKPTILFLTSYAKNSGPGAVALQHARLLHEGGFRVLFCCPGHDKLRREAESLGIWHDHPLALPTNGNVISFLLDWGRLRRLVAREQVNSIFCYRSAEHLLAGYAVGGRVSIVRFAQPRCSSPVIDTAGKWAEDSEAIAERIRGGWLLRKSWTTHILVADPHLRNALVADSVALISAARVSWVSGGVDTIHFTPNRGGNAVRVELGLADADIVLGFVARMKPERQHALVIAAFAKAVAQVPALRLLCIGDGEEKSRLQTRAVELGVGERVAFFAPGSRFEEALAAVDMGVLLHPGSAGTGRAALELMSMARPMITASAGVLGVLGQKSGVASQGGTAGESTLSYPCICLPQWDAAAHDWAGRSLAEMSAEDMLVVAFVTLAKDVDLRFDMGLAAREMIEARYSRRVLQRELIALATRLTMS